MVIATRERCRHCGSTLIIPDGEGRSYCLLCCRPYTEWQDYGALGGQATLDRYGREWFREIGKRGGRPRLRQLSVPKTENKIREEMANNRFLASRNNLKVLKELYRLQQRSKSVIKENGEGFEA